MSSDEISFHDITAEVDALMADPQIGPKVEQELERMAEDDRAHAMGLAALRRAADLTQEDLATQLGITQGAVARTEKRQDMLLSTLNSYVKAIGGHVIITVAFDNGQQVRIDLPDLAGYGDPPRANAA